VHLKASLAAWKRRRGTVAPPTKGGGLHLSKVEAAAIAIVAIIAIAGIAYVGTSSKKTNYFGVTITVQIYGAIDNSTGPGVCCTIPASYDPYNFTVPVGTHLTLKVENTDNVTHGLAVPNWNLDTGPLKPNATAVLTLTASTAGNYTYDEPSVDCGGTGCDVGQALTGWFLVTGS